MGPAPRTRPARAARLRGGALPARPRSSSGSGLRSIACHRLWTRHGPQSLAEGFRPRPAPPCPPDGGMTAFGPRLSLAPGLIRGRPLALQAAGSSRGPRKPAPRVSTTDSIASSTGPGGSLFSRRDRLLVSDCDRGLNSHRVSLRRSPDCFKRIRSRGRKRAAKGSCQ
jgi:hypothetical protein